MTQATFVYVLGLGGRALDPGGAATIRQRVISGFQRLPQWTKPSVVLRGLMSSPISLNVTVPPLFREEDVGDGTANDVAAYLAGRPAGELLLYASDSCGANKATWVATKLKSLGRRLSYMALIQPSAWCNAGEPLMPDNVDEYLCIYASCLLTFGLGCYKVQPVNTLNAHGLAQTLRYPGSYSVNKGKTLARFAHVNDIHPGDQDVANVQNPILTDIKRVLTASNQKPIGGMSGATGFGA